MAKENTCKPVSAPPSGGRESKWKLWKLWVPVLVVVVLAGSVLFEAGHSGHVDKASVQPVDRYAKLIGDAPTIGPADAKVTVIDYHDLSCPHCLVLSEQLQPVLSEYKGKIRFASVPVNVLYNMGFSAEVASFCAREQGRYWQMHQILLETAQPFVGQPKSPALLAAMKAAAAKRTPEALTEMAKTVDGMDADAFLSCMQSGRYDGRIRKTTQHFLGLGFPGVPVLLINGVFFDGMPDSAHIAQAIDNAMQENRG